MSTKRPESNKVHSEVIIQKINQVQPVGRVNRSRFKPFCRSTWLFLHKFGSKMLQLRFYFKKGNEFQADKKNESLDSFASSSSIRADRQRTAFLKNDSRQNPGGPWTGTKQISLEIRLPSADVWYKVDQNDAFLDHNSLFIMLLIIKIPGTINPV